MKVKILFICLGNICRSPAAEGIFLSKIKENNLDSTIFCDSAGIIGQHAGEPADSRMKKMASLRGYQLTGRSRKIVPETDFEYFDLIVAMDNANVSALNAFDKNGEYGHKIYKMTSFCTASKFDEVPDPYYGGNYGFNLVLDILEDACEGLLQYVTKQYKGNE